MIDPERRLSDIERARLAALVPTDGFQTLKLLMEIICEKYKVLLINASPSKAEDVLAAHHMAKASAQFYATLISRIREEVDHYKNESDDSSPVDATEGLLDLGEYIREDV